MRSSSDTAKVLLPTFEEMMKMIAGATVPAEMAGTEPEQPAWQAPAADPAAQAPEAAPPGEPGPEDLLAEAKAQCEALRRQAAEEARCIVEQGRQEARALAQEAREQEAAKARQEMETERLSLRQGALGAAEALQTAKQELYAALEPYLLDTALHMAESILKHELDHNDAAFLAIARNVLEQAPAGEQLTLYLAPGRYDTITAQGGPFIEEMAKQGVALRRDPNMPETDCLVTGEMGSARGGVTTQLARIRYAVRNQQLEVQ